MKPCNCKCRCRTNIIFRTSISGVYSSPFSATTRFKYI